MGQSTICKKRLTIKSSFFSFFSSTFLFFFSIVEKLFSFSSLSSSSSDDIELSFWEFIKLSLNSLNLSSDFEYMFILLFDMYSFWFVFVL